MRYPKANRILLVAVPGFGDALLATPVLRALRTAYPNAVIDMMVRQGSESILIDHPDVSSVIPVPRRPSICATLQLIAKRFRQYDLAVSTSLSDRALFNCIIAAPERILFVQPLRFKNFWKHASIQNRVAFDHSVHVIERNLRLCDALDIPRSYEIIPPLNPNAARILDKELDFNWRTEPIAVVHMFPASRHKRWPKKNWQILIKALRDKGMRIVLTGGPTPDEKLEAQQMKQSCGDHVHEAAGRIPFSTLTLLLSAAVLYVGPDTGTTHLAAATGTKCIALFGPSNPVNWSPWPKKYRGKAPPFTAHDRFQINQNVAVICATCHCNPKKNNCLVPGYYDSPCLASILPEEVLRAVDDLIGTYTSRKRGRTEIS
jgi:heptosyltransferase-3